MQHRSLLIAPRRIARRALLIASLLFVLAQPLAAQAPGAPASNDAPPAKVETKSQGFSATIIELFAALNWWTIPFAAITVIAVWVTADRMVVLRRGRVIPKPFVRRFLRLVDEGELDQVEALQVCEENDSPVAHIFAHGVRKWGKPSVEVEQAIIDGGEREVSTLRSHLRILNGIGTIAPLLGLLGTVWGMLGAFKNISVPGKATNMTELGSDIALALVTTAAGLVIAIPAISVYTWLSGRIDTVVLEMDALSQRLVHCISAEALAERAARPRRTTKAEKPAADEPPPKKRAV